MSLVRAIDIQQKRHDAASGFAAGVASGSGDTTIVAGIAGRKIRVVRFELSAASNVAAYFKSSLGGRISGDKNLGANATLDGSEASCFGHFETVPGEDLVLNLSSAVAVGWDLTYTSEPSP